MDFEIVPSILSADFANLQSEIKKIESLCKTLHIDIMDGHFVQNISFGMPIVKAIRKITNLKLDVHLMIEKPEKYISEFAKAGADSITFHLESTEDPRKCIDLIRSQNISCGISIKPKTPFDFVRNYLNSVDLFLQMTVEPGFGGQSIILDGLKNIAIVKSEFPKVITQVDGGISSENIKMVAEYGVDQIVAGTAIFGNENSYEALEKLYEMLL